MLPKLPRLRVRLGKRGARYYFDAGGTPRHWIPLGSDDAKARKEYDRLIAAPRPPPGTVDAMLAEMLEALRGKVAPGTLRNYQGYRRYLSAVFDDPATITQADVLRYLRTCPRWSFRNEIGVLSLGFVYWMEQGRLSFNPCFGVRIRRKGSKRDRLLLPTEIDAIVEAADERLAVAIELAYATGLRIGDLCALRWAALQGVIDTQKTGARQAFEGLETISALLDRARALQARVGSLYVLCNRRGRALKPDTLRTHWRQTCAKAGVVDAHFHDLRAAGATEVERRGGDAQKFLGHADARTTLIYLRGLRVNVVRPLSRKA
jgi:integrase